MAVPQQNPSINWQSRNLSEEWRKFKDHAKLMFQGPLKRAGPEEQSAYLLIWAGETGREICNSWGLTDDHKKDVTILFERFEAHATPKKNTVFARYVFQERKQQNGEKFDTFVTDLRNLVKDCNYHKPEEMVRDKIVSGISSQEVREKLLTEGDTLTMEKAIEVAITYETTQQHLRSMACGKETNVDLIQSRPRHPIQKGRHTQRGHDRQQSTSNVINCKNCGTQHRPRECPAYGQECLYCHKKNHWAKVCLSKRHQGERTFKKIHTVEEGSGSDDDASLFIDTIAGGKDLPDTAYADVCMETGDILRFKIDTGAQANVIPRSLYQKMTKPPSLSPCKEKLVGYSGQKFNVIGHIQLEGAYKAKTYQGMFYIVDTHPYAQPVLGLQACLRLELIKLVLSVSSNKRLTKENILQEYSHLFTGLGEIKGDTTIHLKEGATPTIHSPRRVPHALKDRLKEELDKLVNTKVITKVTEPTEWVNSLVVVEKPDGKLRICLDPKDLNEAIKRPHYQMPTLDDALAKMAGAKFFSKLDAKSGYWQLKLDEASSLLTTFNTPFGRYRFNRLPFGVVCAQDIFQRKMDELFEGMAGVTSLVDDIVVTGTTREEHDSNLQAVLERATRENLKLNPDKLTVGASEIEYFGHRITSEGLKPDEGKVKAILDMGPPTDKKELQTLLGMITYLSKFAPHTSDITKPMRDLLKEDTEFVWDEMQQSALQGIKEVLTQHPILSYFDPRKEVTLEVDASKSGLGAAIFQEGKPVAYASKSLSSTEQNYAQIEKELYAILFGCKRFHQYVYGRDVKVLTDHKPLEAIAKKPLASAPPRLQRMLLQLQNYRLRIQHIPGKDIPTADALSRKYLPAQADDCKADLDVHVHAILKNLPISDQKAEEIRQATKEDPQLQHLTAYIQSGWPESRTSCHPNTLTFWNFRDELSVIDNIILKGNKIFIPTTLRPKMLTKIHEGHWGIEKSIQRAREIIFWPGMTSSIKEAISSCPTCLTKSSSNPKEPLMSHSIPSRPWQKVATDLFTWNTRNFLITVDYYSRYLELDELTSTTSAAVIQKLSAHFARHGIPETVISDNGPQYASSDFADFAASWDFRHVTSSPGYPQSNGLAERTVQTVKKMLDKAKTDGNNPLLAILEYRSTPVDNLASPAQLLMGRQLRSTLPTTEEQLAPRTIQPAAVIERRQQQQTTQQRYYNLTAHPLPPLKTGDHAFVQLAKGEDWKPAQVIGADNAPRSLVVQTRDGGQYRRNRRFMRPYPTAPATTEPTPPPGEDCSRSDHTLQPPPRLCEHPSQKPTTPMKTQPLYTTRHGRAVNPPKKLDL